MEEWQIAEILRQASGGQRTSFQIPTVDPRTGRVIPAWRVPVPAKRTRAQGKKRKAKRKRSQASRRQRRRR